MYVPPGELTSGDACLRGEWDAFDRRPYLILITSNPRTPWGELLQPFHRERAIVPTKWPNVQVIARLLAPSVEEVAESNTPFMWAEDIEATPLRLVVSIQLKRLPPVELPKRVKANSLRKRR